MWGLGILSLYPLPSGGEVWRKALTLLEKICFFLSQNGALSWNPKCKTYFYDVPRLTVNAAVKATLFLVRGGGGFLCKGRLFYPLTPAKAESFLAFA